MLTCPLTPPASLLSKDIKVIVWLCLSVEAQLTGGSLGRGVSAGL